MGFNGFWLGNKYFDFTFLLVSINLEIRDLVLLPK